MDGLCPGSRTMTGAPCGGFTTRWLVDGRELDGLGLGLEWVDVLGGALGDADVCAELDDALRVGVGMPETARVGVLDEHAAVTPRTHTAATTRPARRSRPERITRPP